MGDIEKYFRWLRLKKFFHKKKTTAKGPTTSKPISETYTFADVPTFPGESHLKCTWTPPEDRNQTLDKYIDCFRNSFQKELVKLSKIKGTTNLSHNEKLAIKTLRCNETIIIKPADKGGAIAEMNKKDYIKEAERPLDDEQYYAKLMQDPLKLIPQDSQPGKFYLLPKIHKPNNPGRPIVSNKTILTEKILQYVEFHLKPYAQNANSLSKTPPIF